MNYKSFIKETVQKCLTFFRLQWRNGSLTHELTSNQCVDSNVTTLNSQQNYFLQNIQNSILTITWTTSNLARKTAFQTKLFKRKIRILFHFFIEKSESEIPSFSMKNQFRIRIKSEHLDRWEDYTVIASSIHCFSLTLLQRTSCQF